MRKFILKSYGVEVGIIFGDDYEFVDDCLLIYLDGYTVARIDLYTEGFSIVFYEVENA